MTRVHIRWIQFLLHRVTQLWSPNKWQLEARTTSAWSMKTLSSSTRVFLSMASFSELRHIFPWPFHIRYEFTNTKGKLEHSLLSSLTSNACLEELLRKDTELSKAIRLKLARHAAEALASIYGYSVLHYNLNALSSLLEKSIVLSDDIRLRATRKGLTAATVLSDSGCIAGA